MRRIGLISRLPSRERCGGVAQLVRALACHARGRGFESRHSRHFFLLFCALISPELPYRLAADQGERWAKENLQALLKEYPEIRED